MFFPSDQAIFGSPDYRETQDILRSQLWLLFTVQFTSFGCGATVWCDSQSHASIYHDRPWLPTALECGCKSADSEYSGHPYRIVSQKTFQGLAVLEINWIQID